MCSTDQLLYRWLKGHIYSSCYYHYQIGSIHLSHCCHILPWLCAWEVEVLLHHVLSLIAYTFRENQEWIFIIIIVQFMMSANSRIRFGVQTVLLCLYNTPSHLSSLCKLIWRHWTHKMSVRYIFVECVSKIKNILSVIHYTIYWDVCFQFTYFPCDDWENVYSLSCYHHQIGSMIY